ncbi:hypothetical protein CXZ10_20360 [Pleomorphomonas diazotrophica]|uniref:Uncharacterized protein n=1 Tax=Pleomorphomonas diazotrophica TaxID=1166257 RepID=A0A1I4V6N3_9HYPH|nr:hypothetical protein [Pleomorphomonas diazotrophica]PKR87401.1 hypothetical protein CXZ10_20360 [Pleomorphomonas diazotrophica]SFM96838.1 hypothetical protein SAMN05192571_110111 [Pleomorphomonas diazotrophica]
MCELSTALMIGGGVLGGAGQISSANAEAKAARYNAEVQRQNAVLAERQARNIIDSGSREEQKQKAMTTQLVGKQKAAMAANGIDPTFGSPLDEMVNTAMQGAIDALTIKTTTYRQADDVRNQAVGYRNQAALLTMQAKNSRTAGMLNAFASMSTAFGKAAANHAKLNPSSGDPTAKAGGAGSSGGFWANFWR